MNTKQIYEKVQQHYGTAAKGTSGTYGEMIAKAFGYSEEELTHIPKDANLGLSCGNPVALANLKEGETVIDLGSGAGFDVFLASKKVGGTGQAIGVDMNDDMLARANRNKEKAGEAASNVSFVKSVITSIELSDKIADCIISNCVVNLVPEEEKQLVFNEMYRLLKPGGRVAISDILLRQEMPPGMKESMALYVGCIAGASRVEQYKEYMQIAGFKSK
jgi:arsenite methyltransferase